MELKKKSIACHYAKALMDFECSQEQVERRAKALKRMSFLLKKEAHLLDFFSIPQKMGREEKEHMLDLCLQEEKGDTLLRAFIFYAIQKGRLRYMPEIAESYGTLMRRRQNILEATLISAVPLEAELKKRIQRKLENFSSHKIHLFEEIDPSCLGGFKILAAGRQFDGTIRGRLDRLRTQL